MKRCPKCRRDYYDDTLLYCLDDGTLLLDGPATIRSSDDEPATAILSEPGAIATGFRGGEEQTRQQIPTTDQTAIFPRGAEAEPQRNLGDLSERPSLSAHRAAKPLVIIGVAVALLVGGFFGYRYFGLNTKQIESIAVMPFVNESGNADVEYLSDGMTETLIGSLSQIPNLNVKARSSVFRYKGKEASAQTVGKELNVQAILNGRVVKRGDDLTLYVELVNTTTENILWKAEYNRSMANLVSLQGEIARDVSNKLRARLSGAEQARVNKSYTENPEAYQLYLKGRYFWNKRTGEALTQSIGYFNQAIERDPNYALAYAGLADAYVLIPVYSDGSPREFLPKAKAAAQKALEIDDTLAEAHTSLANALYFDWSFAEADREFRRAIELNPNYPTAHHWYGQYLRTAGRFDEAIAEVKRAQELDPLSLIINSDLGGNYITARQYDKAIEQLRKTIEMDQSFPVAHGTLGDAYVLKGLFPEAIAEYKRAQQLRGGVAKQVAVGYALAASGQRAEVLKMLDQLKETAKTQYVSPYDFALLYTGLGDKEQAFQWLERGYQDHSMDMTDLKTNPFFDPLRSDPRFADLVRRVGLPQ